MIITGIGGYGHNGDSRMEFLKLQELPHDTVHLVDINQVIEFMNGDPSAATVTELYDFGKLLLDHIRAVRTSYDTKLSSCLGWSSAMLALLVSGLMKWVGPNLPGYLASAGTVLALGAVMASIFGLKSWGGLKWPSEKDWFAPDFLDDADLLKRQHVVAMLEAHQSYSLRTQRKGYALMLAEYLLAGAALCVGAAAILKQLVFV